MAEFERDNEGGDRDNLAKDVDANSNGVGAGAIRYVTGVFNSTGSKTNEYPRGSNEDNTQTTRRQTRLAFTKVGRCHTHRQRGHFRVREKRGMTKPAS